MKIYLVVIGDGCTYSGIWVEAWTDQTQAELRAMELNEKHGYNETSMGGYSVDTVELDVQSED